MAGISDKALKTNYAENKYRFNSGNELQSKEFSDGSGLESYDANFRMYDPQIGRFWQMDPLTEMNESWSPYEFANDNPILLNDPLGADTTCPGCMPQAIVTPPPTPPSSSVTTGLANTNGGDPDVAGAAGAAPTSTSDPIGGGASSTGNEDNPIKHDLDDELGKNPIYNLEHDIVETPSRWQRFINGPMYQGKNVFGEDVYMKYYGGPITGAITGLNVEGEAEGAYTVFQNISKRIRALSTTNFFIGITAAKFEANLAKVAGKAWETSRDGKVKTLIYNGIKYISRLSTEGEPTIDIYRGEELLQKYRLQK